MKGRQSRPQKGMWLQDSPDGVVASVQLGGRSPHSAGDSLEALRRAASSTGCQAGGRGWNGDEEETSDKVSMMCIHLNQRIGWENHEK